MLITSYAVLQNTTLDAKYHHYFRDNIHIHGDSVDRPTALFLSFEPLHRWPWSRLFGFAQQNQPGEIAIDIQFLGLNIAYYTYDANYTHNPGAY